MNNNTVEDTKAVKAPKPGNAPIDKPFFFTAAAIIIGMIVVMVVFDKQTGDFMNAAYNFFAYKFGWAYKT